MEVKTLEAKVQRLQFQNQRLSEKLGVKKQEINSLEDTITKHEERWRDYESTVLCINRCWELLHEDIGSLHSRVTGNELPKPEAEVSACGEGNPTFSADPFVQALIGDGDLKEESDAAAHLSKAEKMVRDVERSLIRRSEKTRAILGALLEDVKRVKREGWANSGRSFEDVATLETDLDKERAVNRGLLERSKTAEDKLFQTCQELKDVRNELADKQGALERADRKLWSLKEANKVAAEGGVKVEAPNPFPPGFGHSTTSGGGNVGGAGAGGGGAAGSGEGVSQAAVGSGEGGVKVEAKEEHVNEEEINAKWKKAMEAKNEEWERERELYIQKEKELVSLQQDLANETHVTETARYRALQDQKSQLMLELKKKEVVIQNYQQQLLAKDRELQRKKNLDPDARCREFQALQEAQKRIADLQQQFHYAEQTRHEAEFELQTERDKRGDVQTVQELKRMVKVLQDEITMKERSFRDRMVSEEKIRSAREESQELGRSWKEAQVKLDRVRQDLEDLERKRRDLEDSQKEHKEVAADLRVFVEVLTTFVQDRRSEAEVRISEEKLRRELAETKEKVGGVRLEECVQELEESRSKLRDITEETKTLHLELDRLSRSNRHLQEDLEQQKSLNCGLEQEVEATGMAYEDMQAQNTRLLQQSTEKDDAIDQLRGQVTQLTQQTTRLKFELDAKKDALRISGRGVEEVALIRSEFEGKVTELNALLSEAREELGVVKRRLETIQEEVQRKDVQIENTLQQVEVVQKTASDRKRAAEEEIEKAVRERNKRQRLEQVLKVVRGGTRGSDLSNDDKKELEILDKEVKSLRKTLSCSVCESNRKSVILTKCWHTFCSQCIRNRLETRNRKCPGCGTPFGQADVKSLFLT